MQIIIIETERRVLYIGLLQQSFALFVLATDAMVDHLNHDPRPITLSIYASQSLNGKC